MNIVNLLELENGEKITAMFPIQEFADDKFLFFVTRQGIAKRIVLSDLQNIRRAGLRALSLNEDDALVDVRLTDGEQNILIATHNGKAICFDENEVRAMSRTATGVRGIKLADGDYVIGAARARKRRVCALRHRKRLRQAHAGRGIHRASSRRRRHHAAQPDRKRPVWSQASRLLTAKTTS